MHFTFSTRLGEGPVFDAQPPSQDQTIHPWGILADGTPRAWLAPALPAATQPTPPCTHLRNVGYNSAFTRHTIWNARVIPIRPTQATTIFNQCRSGEETHRGRGEQVRTVPVELPGKAVIGTLDFRAGRAGKVVLSDPSIVDT